MTKARTILMVVEGDKTEPRLIQRALDVYGIDGVDEVYTYRANVYDLYRRLVATSPELDDFDLALMLRDGEEEYSERWNQLNKRFSDVILVFDFDPQDHLFSAEKLNQMLRLFNESTDLGKLYINYPMVEGYKDFVSLPYDETYNQRFVDYETLKRKGYKELVGRRSVVPQLDSCNVLVFNQMLTQSIEKAARLVHSEYNPNDPLMNYRGLSQVAIFQAQMMILEEKDAVSVLCTCLWFVIDYGPQRISRLLKSYAS